MIGGTWPPEAAASLQVNAHRAVFFDALPGGPEEVAALPAQLVVLQRLAAEV
eukprot:CAMPEP_0179320778 /NCGR_PEP_ID=MMETSP0797-20121207/58245_1 /TAXON_ID=47934 /ORGANISM="Dinophysis acuminata, Strain DAEP01" /LENGTH=51 /DNA_ID=CAMNT_0021032329 /DNA_START=5 /DNA_END=158 /DNA_ORIENTATION=-